MPLGKYYRGHGAEVMAHMRSEYGSDKKAKQVFYATANARGVAPKRKVKRPKKT